jgi:hypothetical protein
VKSGFNWPIGVITDNEDDIAAMVDNLDHCVHIIDSRTRDLTIISSLGKRGSNNQRFNDPYFAVFLSTPQKRGLYISDNSNNRIQYYNRVSRSQYKYDNTISITDGFNPRGI